jgi:pilus assembly protein Flp/PilA
VNAKKIEEVKFNMLSIYVSLQNMFARLADEEEGQGLAEYALILALIAVVAIVALSFLGKTVSTVLGTVGSSL